jgi:GNAT superfamily N-acetyltransferase
LLMDTLCYYASECNAFAQRPFAVDDDHLRHERREAPIEFRFGGPGDAALVESIARDAFANYGSHYANDLRLPGDAVAEIYPSWARSSCERVSPGEPVLIAMQGGAATGFVSTRRGNEGEMDVALLGVRSNCRGQGTAAALLQRLGVWSAEAGLKRLTYSTQLTNVPMLRLLSRVGFLPTHSVYTFHHWCTEVTS